MKFKLYIKPGSIDVIRLFSRKTFSSFRLKAKTFASILSIWFMASDKKLSSVRGLKVSGAMFRIFSLLMNKNFNLGVPMKALLSIVRTLFPLMISVIKLCMEFNDPACNLFKLLP